MDVSNRTVLITGGLSGLGESCVKEFLEQKSNCVIFDIKNSRDKYIQTNNVFFKKVDISKEKEVKKAVDETISVYKSIEVLINCAGIGIPYKVIGNKNIGEMGFIEAFRRTLEVNLIGFMNSIRCVAKYMMNNCKNDYGERGVIINTSSIASFQGEIGQAAYSASKAGIIGMMSPIYKELSHYGIRVVTISPGLFETPMFRRLPEKIKMSLESKMFFPKMVAKPSYFAKLASHVVENSFLNGETICIDSGIRM